MFRCASADDTRKLGTLLAQKLSPGDVVCLTGELGAGKTTMVKGMAPVFGLDEHDITSPSFTIIAEYGGNPPLYHIDLYRLDEKEIGSLGLREYLYGEGISVIEWAEKAGAEVPDTCIRVNIMHAENGTRTITIQGIKL